ncbi:MAG: hypothetical protein V1681_01835 [Candidatus Neomarinimicrobiota bacterium]
MMNISTQIRTMVILALISLIIINCDDAYDEYSGYRYENDFYIVNSNASGLKQITVAADYVANIEFLPDGSGIIFETRGNMSGNFLYDLTSGEMTAYENENPDSIQVYYRNGEIFLINYVRSDTVNISDSDDYDYDPLLINGNTRVIYLTSKYDDELGRMQLIQLMDLMTGENQVIDTLQGRLDMMDYSDDRSLIVYLENVSPFAKLWLFSATNFSTSEICETFWTNTVDFSPDNTAIVLNAYSGNYKDLFLVNLNSGEKSRLTESEASEYQPLFSPDGTQILFVSRNNDKSCLRIIDRDGSNLLTLTPEYENIYEHCFSSDGKMIAFTCE